MVLGQVVARARQVQLGPRAPAARCSGVAAMMSSLLPTSALFVATNPVDLRKAFDGLATLVRQSLGQDPLTGSVYVFPIGNGTASRSCSGNPVGFGSATVVLSRAPSGGPSVTRCAFASTVRSWPCCSGGSI